MIRVLFYDQDCEIANFTSRPGQKKDFRGKMSNRRDDDGHGVEEQETMKQILKKRRKWQDGSRPKFIP
ncbi:MAG: hypothetical protein ACOX6S_00360 [Clostridia bacterium]|jgi:hypothetical protein